jgi:hypothetical protein
MQVCAPSVLVLGFYGACSMVVICPPCSFLALIVFAKRTFHFRTVVAPWYFHSCYSKSTCSIFVMCLHPPFSMLLLYRPPAGSMLVLSLHPFLFILLLYSHPARSLLVLCPNPSRSMLLLCSYPARFIVLLWSHHDISMLVTLNLLVPLSYCACTLFSHCITVPEPCSFYDNTILVLYSFHSLTVLAHVLLHSRTIFYPARSIHLLYL